MKILITGSNGMLGHDLIDVLENDNELIAIMDLIDGYPDETYAFIGFFMMHPLYQGKEIGSSIIGEVCQYLIQIGKKKVRLAIDKENPQSNHFWKKNGFEVLKEVKRNEWIILIAEKIL